VVFGAGVAYQSLHSRIKSLENRADQSEKLAVEDKKEITHKLDTVLNAQNELKVGMGRIEERIHKSL